MFIIVCFRSANDEIDKMRKTQEDEIVRLQAAVKRYEVTCNGQEHTIEQRVSASDQRTVISIRKCCLFLALTLQRP